MSDSNRPLAPGVAPVRVDDARLNRTWRRVQESLARGPKRGLRGRVIPPLALALAAAVIAFVVRSVMVPEPGPRSLPVATASSLNLPDGSRVFEAPGTRLAVKTATPERVELLLEAGEVDLDVTHVDGRRFAVLAAGHEVTVLGTRFKVRLTQGATETLEVSVERGSVRVAGPSGDLTLGAGQRWSAAVASTATPATASESSSEPGTVAPPAGSGTAASPVRVAPAPAPEDNAKELFGRAVDARRAGHDGEAAAAFDSFRKRFRSDTRAGVAAFELGRIRLDSLHDAGGAVEAFTDAIALSPNASFREDAEARRVDAFDKLGDRSRCADARAKYLARYPAGVHVPQITLRCGAR